MIKKIIRNSLIGFVGGLVIAGIFAVVEKPFGSGRDSCTQHNCHQLDLLVKEDFAPNGDVYVISPDGNKLQLPIKVLRPALEGGFTINSIAQNNLNNARLKVFTWAPLVGGGIPFSITTSIAITALFKKIWGSIVRWVNQ